MRFSVLLLLLFCTLLTSANWRGVPLASQEVLARQEWSRRIEGEGWADGTTVKAELKVEAQADTAGRRALVVDITAAAGGAHAALLNGAVLLALPLGIEPDGPARLYWVNDKGAAAFAYSKEISKIGSPGEAAIPGHQEDAGKNARATDPPALIRQLGEASLALDPALAIVVPSDPRITGHALSLSWRVPCTLSQKALVDPFKPEASLGRATHLRAVFPLKGSAEMPLVVYFGALSCVGNGTATAAEWISWEGEAKLPPPAALEQPKRSTGTAKPPGGVPAAEPPKPQPNTPQPKPVQSDSRANEVLDGDPSDAPAEPAQPSAVQAREVKPGTLALEPELFRVPLKPITGSGAGTSAAGNMATAQAGPSQLSPQAGAALAAPAAEMVLIPAGTFEMGTSAGPLDDRADEAPQHSVDLPAYYIDKLPVTNRQFYNFVISSGYKPEGGWQKYYEPATADLPVRGVSWGDANAYARWAGKRLPSEAEWEKAARGTDARTYPWGEDWSSEIIPRSENYYALVGSPKIASPYGVLAMCGILWQWTASSYAAYPFNAKAGGDKKVLRGGCYSNGRNIVRCANRYAEPPAVALNTFTFRCAKDAQ